jgi:murein DD-endopeptidase MepM/ murein hydrolase activator NlpD
MRNTWILPCVLWAGSAVAGVSFSGTWVLDPARSTGLPPGLEQTLVVEQSGDALDVKTTLITDSRDLEIHDVYALGAGERDFEAHLPAVIAKVARRTAVRAGELGLNVSDHVEGNGPNGPATVDILRRWELSADGRTLTIDQDVTNNGLATHSHRVLALAATGGEVVGTARPSRMFPVDLRVPVAPTAFRSAGRTNLVYEVHVTNLRVGDIEWKRLDVLDDDGHVLGSYLGADLEGLLIRPGAADGQKPQRIAGGMQAVAFLWLPLDGAAPKRLHHRAVFGIPASAAGNDRIVEGTPVDVRTAPVVLGPPMRGGDWVARWISNESFHRRGLMAVDGSAAISQRFAIDWNRFAADGREWIGDGAKNEDYSVFGQEAIAVADALVARVVDGIPLNEPGSLNPSVVVGLDTAAGNSVALRLADGTYATYAHLQPGSILVKEGQHVVRGDILGKVGNSGNATGPHLHFHVSTGPGLEGEGVPYVFDAFTVVGHEAAPAADGRWSGRSESPEIRNGELPADHEVVRFAGEATP